MIINNLIKITSPFCLLSDQFKLLFLPLILILLSGCSSSGRFTGTDDLHLFADETVVNTLLEEASSQISMTVSKTVFLYSDDRKTALIKPANRLTFQVFNDELKLMINGKVFSASKFYLKPENDTALVGINGNSYRGYLKIVNSDSGIKLVNTLLIEDYVKGVMTKEMPVGTGTENFEALKAFAICVRTYALMKLGNGNIDFDLYSDTRDQVYGGADAEYPMSDSAVEATRGVILTYSGNPAIVYYHSTCGGHTENSVNVFTDRSIPYLTGIPDGSPPYCSISPRFSWEEQYSETEFIKRLTEAGYLSDKFTVLDSVSVISRFESGRVNNLRIIVSAESGETKQIDLFGNSIRNIIRNSDNSAPLRSTLFDINLNSDLSVKIKGNGFGHGVGLCQYGSIFLSKSGWNYKSILNHYFPGTNITTKYDQK